MLMTHWGNHIAIASTLLSMRLGIDMKASNRKDLTFLTICLLEAGLIMQILIVSIYWPFIHDFFLEELILRDDFPVVYLITVVIHSWPFLAVLLNVILSQV